MKIERTPARPGVAVRLNQITVPRMAGDLETVGPQVASGGRQLDRGVYVRMLGERVVVWFRQRKPVRAE